jgi:hypothetical protein
MSSGETMAQPACDALVAEGKAQAFAQTSRGFIPVRTAGPLIGDRVFRVLGAGLVTRQMATAYAGSPGQRAMLGWMIEQSKYRGFAEGTLNSLRHYDFQWRPQVFQALGRSGVPQTELLTLDGAGHAITYGGAEDVLDGFRRFLRDSAR